MSRLGDKQAACPTARARISASNGTAKSLQSGPVTPSSWVRKKRKRRAAFRARSRWRTCGQMRAHDAIRVIVIHRGGAHRGGGLLQGLRRHSGANRQVSWLSIGLWALAGSARLTEGSLPNGAARTSGAFSRRLGIPAMRHSSGSGGPPGSRQGSNRALLLDRRASGKSAPMRGVFENAFSSEETPQQHRIQGVGCRPGRAFSRLVRTTRVCPRRNNDAVVAVHMLRAKPAAFTQSTVLLRSQISEGLHQFTDARRRVMCRKREFL